MGASVKERMVNYIVDNLTLDGEKAIQTAYNRRGFKNRTYNLHDSYGSAVFVDGVLRRRTIRYAGARLADMLDEREIGDYSGERSFPNKVQIPMRINGDNRYLHGDTLTAKGRDELYRFLIDYEASIKGTKGIQLVIVAAMFYASILEKGGGRLRRKYRVISGAGSVMRQLKQKYGGEVYRLNIQRHGSKPYSGAFTVSRIPFK